MSPPELQRTREKNPTLELKIISAFDVSHINETCKMDVYAVVSITGDNIQNKQAAKTPIDFYGGSNPTWNHTVKLSFNEEAALLSLKVKLFSYWLEGENDLYLGEVNVSVQELLASNPLPPFANGNDDKLTLVNYPVKVTERTKGTLSLSYRLNPAATADDLYPSAPDYSLLFGQPDYPNPDPASSGPPLYLNPDPTSLGHPVTYSPQFQTTMTKLTLMLVIKSAKDIKSVSIRNEMNVYASVMIREGKTTIKNTINTPIAYCAYRNPRWDHEVEFSLDEKLVREGHLTLVVKLIGVRPLFGDKNVGVVEVSIQELFGLKPSLTNGDDDNGMSLVTRGVTGPRGDKGTLRFTYRFLTEQVPQPFVMYQIPGTSGYAIVPPGTKVGPSNGPQYHQSNENQQYSPLQSYKQQAQPQPLHKPVLLHTQSHQSNGHQQYLPPQLHNPQSQVQPLHQPQLHTLSHAQPQHSNGYQQYSLLQPQSQVQPLHQPQLHTQSQSQLYSYQQYFPPQPQLQQQPLPQQLPLTQHPTQIEPQTQGARPTTKSQERTIAALGIGAAIAGRVIGGALMGEMMSDEVNMYEAEA